MHFLLHIHRPGTKFRFKCSHHQHQKKPKQTKTKKVLLYTKDVSGTFGKTPIKFFFFSKFFSVKCVTVPYMYTRSHYHCMLSKSD